MSMNGQITHFRGVLPPRGKASSARPRLALKRRPAPSALILQALTPLREEIDSALACGDRPTALTLAYHALTQVTDALAAFRGDRLEPGQRHIHALFVELEALPLQPQPDGTLTEAGTQVTVSYRNWAVAQAEAQAAASAVTRRLLARWPGAWVFVSPDSPHAAERFGVGR